MNPNTTNIFAFDDEIIVLSGILNHQIEVYDATALMFCSQINRWLWQLLDHGIELREKEFEESLPGGWEINEHEAWHTSATLVEIKAAIVNLREVSHARTQVIQQLRDQSAQ
jgi:hypothetical protein